MMRLLILWLAATALLHAVPVTLNFSAQGAGGALGTTTASDLPVGCRVMIGTFSLTPAQIIAASDDQFTLLAAFQPWGSATVGTFNGSPQNIRGAFASSVNVESAQHAGKRIYLWAFDAPSLAAANSNILLSSPTWVVPSFGSILCETSQIPFTQSTAVVIATRQSGTTSATLGGTLNQAIALAHPDASDRDNDGVPALIEWAIGTQPSQPDASPLQLRNGALTFARFAGATGSSTDFSANGIRYRIESSQNMTQWLQLPAASTHTPTTASHPTRADMEILTLPLIPDAQPRRFWRLAISRN